MQLKTQRRTLNWLRMFGLIVLSMTGIGAFAQTTVTITCTGAAGSFNSGSVSSAGTKNDGNMITINSSSNRGWAHYNLSSIPAGAIITAVTANFTTYTSTSSAATNNLYGFSGNPATIAGATLYANCASGTSFNASTWTANASQAKVFNATGIAFIQSMAGTNNCNIGYVRGSTNTYNIYGYSGATPPNLVITYNIPSPCTGTPAPGNTLSTSTSVCSGSPFTLSLQNGTAGTGVTYQWYNGAGAISGATNATYTQNISSTDSYYCTVTCSGQSGTSTPITVNMSPCIIMTNGSVTTCSGNFYDSGGPTGQYLNNENYTLTINPNPGNLIQLAWNSFASEAGFDFITIYNGPSTSSPILYGPSSGTLTIPTFVSSDASGALTVRFTSDGSVVANGWDATISCIPNPACSGAPNPGNTVSNVTSACPGGAINLSLQNLVTGTGITFQWYSNTLGAIAGATNSTYSTTLSAPTDDFWCSVTCTNTSQTVTSNPVTITMNSFLNCYCAAAALYTADEEIYNVTIGGASTPAAYANANGCTTVAPGPGSALSLYSNFKTLGPTFSVMQGSTSTFEIRQNECDGATYYANGIGMWIDYNQNGLFTDPGEAIYIQGATSAATGPSPGGDKVVSGTFTIPASALLGQTVVRVISSEGVASPTPCANPSYGEVEDYIIDITVNTLCTGLPNPGNTIASATALCPSTTASFSLQNVTTGTGITYQWYSNSAGAIAGATNAFYSQVITTPDDFWCTVTCSGSGLTGTSNPVSVALNPFYNCYCSSSATSTADEEISNVTFGSLNNSSTCTTLAPGPGSVVSMYSNYKSGTGAPAPVPVMMGQSVPFSVTMTTCGGNYTNKTNIYIDYNQNGQFTDAGELVFNGPTAVGNHTDAGIITIPFTATAGQTAMRVVNVESTVVNPCGTYTWGETEDYLIDIAIAVPCSGNPNPGNTIASSSSACPNTTVNLSLQNLTPGMGVTYQWISGINGPIAGATNSTYSPVITVQDDFWCEVSCNAGTPVPSNPVTISVSGFINCYCSSGLGGSCAINAMSSVAIAGTTLSNVTSGCTGPYNAFPASGSTTASLTAGNTYTMNVGVITGSNTQVAVWLDANQDGIFSASEYTLINGNIASGGSGSGTFTVPITALGGNTGLRVRSDWQGTTAWTPADACTLRTWGETEDYIVNIILPNNCTGTPNPGNTIASASSVCPNGTVTLSLSNAATLGAGVTFQWMNNAGAIPGATNSFYTATMTAANNFFCNVTCANSGIMASSNPVSVGLNNFFSCYCTSSLHSANSPCIDQITFNSLVNNSAAAGCALPAYTAFPATTATTTVFQGFSYTLTRVASGTGAWTGVWIDYDHSGTFDVSEYTNLSTVATGALSNSVSITIPFTALTGQTGMRIRQRVVDMTAADACTPNFGSGETEDYVIDIQIATGCTGTPTPGNTLASASSVCPGQTVTLSLSGQASLGSGNNYQWFNNAGAIAGATNPTYAATMTAADAFYCNVTCTNSSQSAASVSVSVGINSFFACYCASGATTTFDEEIYSVTVNGASTPAAYAGVNGCTTAAPGPGSILNRYSNFTSLGTFTTMMAGNTISFTVEENECDGATYYAFGTSIWIDFNQNGSYADPGEQVFVESATAVGPRNVVGTFTIPYTALTGQTGMRITVAEGLSGASLTPCLSYGYGETEDYIVSIIPSIVCTGTPAPGNTIASATAVCSGTTVNFSLQNATIGSGVTYQWYNNSGAIAGATNSTYSQVMTAADAFYCAVTCSGQTGISASVAITINAPLSCYCAAGATTIGCTTGDEYVGNVTLNTINNTSTCPASGQYSDFTTISTNLIQGSTYTASVLIPNWFGGDQASVWIDFNQDGILDDVTEQFPLTTGGGSGATPLSGPVTVPATALTGPTRMRVRGNYTGVMSSCGITTYGEVEDYTVIINPAVTSTTLNLTAYIQAYWNGTSAMNPTLSNQMQANPTTDCDSVTVELRTASSPLTVAYSTVSVLHTDGTAACVFPSGVTPGYYYIAVKGRNMIETWSADSVSISGATAAYNFTTAAAQAYGGNMIELTTGNVPNGLFAFYSGDIVKDAGEATDLLDLNQLETEINNFSFGYYAEDLNGDGNVDILDTPSLEGNISAFIYSIHP